MVLVVWCVIIVIDIVIIQKTLQNDKYDRNDENVAIAMKNKIFHTGKHST